MYLIGRAGEIRSNTKLEIYNMIQNISSSLKSQYSHEQIDIVSVPRGYVKIAEINRERFIL
jgi:hypothetical protein